MTTNRDRLNSGMKMAELMDRDNALCGVLERVGLSFGFGDETVGEVCTQSGIDSATFLLICNVYLSEDYTPSREILEKIDLRDIIRYLRLSHTYYEDTSAKSLSLALDSLMSPCDEKHKMTIGRFFADYARELSRHFDYEETVVFPYVESMLDDNVSDGFSIAQYEKHHSDVQEKLGDLKKLIMTCLPPQCEHRLIKAALSEIFTLETDLRKHTIIEDRILIPAVSCMEETDRECNPENSVAKLSSREIEILTGVAQGLLNKEIAAKCNISIHTVITHRKNIASKTGIKTIAGLTAYAILNNLIDAEALMNQD